MSRPVPKHHLFAFGHNPFQKLGPPPSLNPESPTIRTASSILSTPTDVLPHLISSCDHIIRSSLRSSGLSFSEENVEIKGEFVWSCYSSSLVKLRWFWSESEEVQGNDVDGPSARTENAHEPLGKPDMVEGPPSNERAQQAQVPSEDPDGQRVKAALSPTATSNESSSNPNGKRPSQANPLMQEGYQYVLLGHPPDDIDPDNLLSKEQKETSLSVGPGVGSAASHWTTLLNLPKDIKVIGFDQIEAFLDVRSGSIRSISPSIPGPSRGLKSGLSESRRKSLTSESNVPVRWEDAATLTDGTIYLVPTTQEHESGQVGIWEFDNVDSLLRFNRESTAERSGCRFIPISVAIASTASTSASSRSAANHTLTLHPGHSHLIIHSPRPYPQTFGLGDNRFHSACPSVATSTGSLRTPREIDDLSAIPITWIGGGDRVSGAISEAGEAWTWGKGVGQGTVQNVVLDPRHNDIDIKRLAIAEDFMVAVTEDNQVWTKGQNDWGQLGFPPSILSDIFDISPQSRNGSEWNALPFFKKGSWEIEGVSARNWATWIDCVKAEGAEQVVDEAIR